MSGLIPPARNRGTITGDRVVGTRARNTCGAAKTVAYENVARYYRVLRLPLPMLQAADIYALILDYYVDTCART